MVLTLTSVSCFLIFTVSLKGIQDIRALFDFFQFRQLFRSERKSCAFCGKEFKPKVLPIIQLLLFVNLIQLLFFCNLLDTSFYTEIVFRWIDTIFINETSFLDELTQHLSILMLIMSPFDGFFMIMLINNIVSHWSDFVLTFSKINFRAIQPQNRFKLFKAHLWKIWKYFYKNRNYFMKFNGNLTISLFKPDWFLLI